MLQAGGRVKPRKGDVIRLFGVANVYTVVLLVLEEPRPYPGETNSDRQAVCLELVSLEMHEGKTRSWQVTNRTSGRLVSR